MFLSPTDDDFTMRTLTAPSHIAILGAGLMGRLLALELAREGHRVEVFEAKGREADGAAARVAAAMLAPLAESAVTEPGVVRMGQYALTRWPELIAQLDAPGSGMTRRPAARTASTMRAPGSDTAGVPASETRAMRSPACRRAMIFSAASRSLCSCAASRDLCRP